MKLNLRKLVLVAAVAILPQLISAQTYEVTAVPEDGYVSDPAVITDNNPYLWNEMKLGMSAVDGSSNSTSAIIPFQLPNIPTGKTVVGAKLKVYVVYGREWISANVDLYGLPFVADNGIDGSMREIHPEDHYAGQFAVTQGSRGAVGIEDDYFAKNVDIGNLDTPRYEETSNETALVEYINNQITDGAVEADWLFLRLSIDDEASANANYFQIEGGDQAHPAILTIIFEDDSNLSNESIEKGSLSIYPNPVVNGEFTVSTVGMKSAVEMTIFNVTGKLVAKQALNVSANKAIVNVDLQSGLYIIQLTDGEVIKTQKLSIK